MLKVAGQASQTHYHSISSEILPHFYVKNICLAQKLTKLEHYKEIRENLIEKSLKIQKFKSTNVCWSFFDTFYYVKQCYGSHTKTLYIYPEGAHS